MRSDGQIDERPDVGSREIEAIRQAIVRLRQFRFCGPGDDPDEQLAVTMGYRHLLIQLKRLATPLLPVDAATRLNALDVEIDNIYTVYEAAPEVDALIPVIEKTVDPIETHRLLPELPATERLREVLERRGLSSVREELDRVVLNVAGDPPTSITAASSMLESLFKCFLEDGGHAQPTKKTAKPLWNRASKHLSLDELWSNFVYGGLIIRRRSCSDRRSLFVRCRQRNGHRGSLWRPCRSPGGGATGAERRYRA